MHMPRTVIRAGCFAGFAASVTALLLAAHEGRLAAQLAPGQPAGVPKADDKAKKKIDPQDAMKFPENRDSNQRL
jgi:hypothetical protein